MLNFVPTLSDHHPEDHNLFQADLAPRLDAELEALKTPDENNRVVWLKEALSGEVIAISPYNIPIMIGGHDEFSMGLSPEGFFIARSPKDRDWEYKDLGILFLSKKFIIEGTPPGTITFTSPGTGQRFSAFWNRSQLFWDSDHCEGHFETMTDNQTFYDIFPGVISALLSLTRASIETGNPIEWY
jgi:hypothetical protein